MITPGGPGWNDPPSLSYETHTQTTSRRNLLTKRVGLPSLTVPNEPTVSQPHDKGFLPPTATKDLPPPPKMKTQVENTSPASSPPKTSEKKVESLNPAATNTVEKFLTPFGGENKAASHGLKNEGVTIFNPSEVENKEGETDKVTKVEDELNRCDIESLNVDVIPDLKKLAERCHDNEIISTSVKNTIFKKIAILEKQINDKKLPDPVLKKVETLTKFLILEKYDKAWDIHLALVCDHSSSVMQWMAGVKKLITEAKKLKE